MASSAPPPPPPPPKPILPGGSGASAGNGVTPAQTLAPFSVKGTCKEATMFEFKGDTKQGAVPLRVVVSRFLSSHHHQSTFQAEKLFMILGRLRCLRYTIGKYNQGLDTSPPPPSFLLYWRRKALDLLSGFGFQVADAQQRIEIVGLDDLVVSVEGLFSSEIESARDLIRSGLITFDGLGELYQPEVPVKGVAGGLGGVPCVFLVTECYYEERRSLMGFEKSFHWAMDFVSSLGDHFTVVSFKEVLSGWTGVRARPLSDLLYVPVSDADELAIFRERGKKYAKLGAGGAQFLAYGPQSFFIHASPSSGGAWLSRSASCQLPKGGRVMVDPARGALLGHHAAQGMDEATNAMMQAAGRYRRWRNSQAATGGSSSSSSGSGTGGQDAMTLWQEVPEDMALYCWPAMVGFSFSAKAWGHVLVSALEPIQFQDQAFDQLVLPDQKKQLIRALVRFGGEGDLEDIVGGKRGGSVFLLHGPPGVGKTLTAEAIAEVLHRPLYYVTMGELGMTPDDMEKRLSDVLDLCAGWNALTLLDEADVFLEQRSTSDIVRNAMVCVMLRLLEYHPGILFLTTNRVKTFDPAFESRVTVALRYEQLSEAARVQVWKNLVQRVTVPLAEDLNYEALGKHVLNGRQIKNSVRLAMALARDRASVLSQDILETTLEVTNLGRQEMNADDSWKEK